MNTMSTDVNGSPGLLLQKKSKHSAEVRIPNRLLSCALIQKNVKALRVHAAAKLYGNHRVEIGPLLEALKIHPKTGKRVIEKIVQNGWAHTDGRYLFPRSWRRLNLSKRGGLYMVTIPLDVKRFEALCFSKALKKIISRRASPARPQTGRAKPSPDLPTTYLYKALGLKERRFKMLKAQAQRYGFIKVFPQVKIIGKAKDYRALKKNLPGVPVFKRGKHSVVPEISQIKILI